MPTPPSESQAATAKALKPRKAVHPSVEAKRRESNIQSRFIDTLAEQPPGMARRIATELYEIFVVNAPEE